MYQTHKIRWLLSTIKTKLAHDTNKETMLHRVKLACIRQAIRPTCGLVSNVETLVNIRFVWRKLHSYSFVSNWGEYWPLVPFCEFQNFWAVFSLTEICEQRSQAYQVCTRTCEYSCCTCCVYWCKAENIQLLQWQYRQLPAVSRWRWDWRCSRRRRWCSTDTSDCWGSRWESSRKWITVRSHVPSARPAPHSSKLHAENKQTSAQHEWLPIIIVHCLVLHR